MTRSMATTALLAALLSACGDDEGDGDGGGDRVLGRITVALDLTRKAVRGGESLAGNLVADAVRAGLPEVDVALVNGGDLRHDDAARPDGLYPAGPFTEADLREMLPFPFAGDPNNDVVVLTVTGARLTHVLERSVCSLQSPDPPADSYDELKGWFLHASGLRYVADTTRQAQVYNADTDEVTVEGERIVEAAVAGQAVTPSATYRLALTAFLANGTDGHVALREATERRTTGRSYPDYVRDHLLDQGTVTPALEGRIEIR